MSVATANRSHTAAADRTSLVAARCEPCEGGIEPMHAAEARDLLMSLDGWTLSSDGKAIERLWNSGDFARGMALLDRIATIAEAEQHHPDVHLTGYRHVHVELTTHAIGGLSRNDFIVAAKIDEAERQHAAA